MAGARSLGSAAAAASTHPLTVVSALCRAVFHRPVASASELPMTQSAVSVVRRASEEAIRLGEGISP